MIADPRDKVTDSSSEKPAGLVVLDIGNTSVHLGVWSDKGVYDVQRVATGDQAGLSERLASLRDNSQGAKLVGAVIGCVVPGALVAIEEAVGDSLDLETVVIGRDVPLPLTVALDCPESVGVDRVCAAAAAFEKVNGLCAVLDFGTALTVDLVDGDGAFQGGAILPGLRLQTEALGHGAAALPTVSVEFPAQPVGKDTAQAIRSGVCYGLVGAARNLVEEFARHLNQWPYVIATGGDVETMLEHCDFVDAAYADLCLRGVGLAYVKYLDAQSEDE